MRTRKTVAGRMVHATRVVAVGSLVVGGLMFAAASPASATLGTCHTSFSNNDDRGLYQVHCDGSPPQEYRAWIKCTNGHESTVPGTRLDRAASPRRNARSTRSTPATASTSTRSRS